MEAKLTTSATRNLLGVGAAPDTANITTTSSTALAANANRVAMIIMNQGENNVWLGFGANAAVVDNGVWLAAFNGTLTFDAGFCSTEAIQAITEVSTATLSIQEFNKY